MAKYTDSPLVNYTRISPCNSGTRTHKIDRITPHCVVGQASVEGLGEWFQSRIRETAPNYGIGADGRVGLYVHESDRSWCSSSNANDQRAVTIECASDAESPYAFRRIVYDKLIALIVDICQRNGITRLLWLGSKDKTLSYEPKTGEAVLTAHCWFANKACPGPWLLSRYGEIAETVTKRLQGGAAPSGTLFRVQVGAFGNKANADAFAKQVSEKGFPTIVREEAGPDGKAIYRVQCGAFSVRGNAVAYADRLKAAGFDAIIKEVRR